MTGDILTSEELAEVTEAQLEEWRRDVLFGAEPTPMREGKRIMSLIAEVKRLQWRLNQTTECLHWANGEILRLRQALEAE